MNSYEFRRTGGQWEQCDTEKATEILEFCFGINGDDGLKRLSTGEVISTRGYRIRVFDPSTAPFATRPLPGQNEHGDYIFAQ